MAGERVGYIRVSTVDQNTERQLEGVKLDRAFTDKASGKDADRPALIEALRYARRGDTFVAHSMDRVARNLHDLRRIVDDLTGRGVTVEFVKERLTFTGDDSPISKLLLNVIGSVAEFERSLILERQREGIAIAKARGKYRGRAPKLSPKEAAEVRTQAEAGVPKVEIARAYGVSRQALYGYLRKGA
jgi:DNA invertase Pin-like site-specific DNA recombinase